MYISLLFKRTTLHYTSIPYPPPTLTHKHSFTHLKHIIANRFLTFPLVIPFFWLKKKIQLHVSTLPYPVHTPYQPSNHPPTHTHTYTQTQTYTHSVIHLLTHSLRHSLTVHHCLLRDWMLILIIKTIIIQDFENLIIKVVFILK